MIVVYVATLSHGIYVHFSWYKRKRLCKQDTHDRSLLREKINTYIRESMQNEIVSYANPSIVKCKKDHLYGVPVYNLELAVGDSVVKDIFAPRQGVFQYVMENELPLYSLESIQVHKNGVTSYGEYALSENFRKNEKFQEES